MTATGHDLSDFEQFWTLPLEQRYAEFARLRDEEPIKYFAESEAGPVPPGRGYWAVTRYRDVAAVSRRPEDFRSGEGTNIPDLPPEFNDFFGSMINLDNPRHARLRKLVSHAFTKRMVQATIDDIGTVARRIVDEVADRGEIDFVTEVAARLPLTIICNMMAIPESQHQMVFDHTNVILGAGDPEFVDQADDIVTALLTAGAELAGLMHEIAESKRGDDSDDLTTALVNGEVDGDRLTNEEIQSFFVLLCAAGNETTRNAISWGLHFLTEHPAERERWQADVDRVTPTAVDEIVRMASPVIHFRRTVTRDGVTLGDRTFEEGDKVVMFYPAANRDPEVFDAPNRFDVERSPNPHLGFGVGPHFCLGAHLARVEIATMFNELFATLPDIQASGPPDRLRSNFINGIKHLPATFTPVAPRRDRA